MRYSIFIFCVIFFSHCNTGEKEATGPVEARDTTITVENAYSELFLDSLSLEKFLAEHTVNETSANQYRSFYNARNYQYAWFVADGITEQTHSFLNRQGDYISYSKDSSLQNAALQQLFDTVENGSTKIKIPDNLRLEAELMLTGQFFRFAEKAFAGDTTLNVKDLKWYIPRKKVDVVATLDSLMKGNGNQPYEPLNAYYKRLKTALIRYYELEKRGGWQPVTLDKKSLRHGDSSVIIGRIKKRLARAGDFLAEDSSDVFTDSLVHAVRRFQYRYGLTEDGIIGESMVRELNTPVEKRIRQMLINLERMRWVPEDITGDYLLVNIPEFKLHVFENAVPVKHMDVVVGSGQHNTVIFSDYLKYVVFSPYWNVPASIVKNEIMPGIQRNPNYIKSHNMEITGYSGNIPQVRQKPGPNNSLGRVKFLFPNNFNIYMHDTPAKSLFGETKRAFSHGCIRLSEPEWLAQFLLRNDSTWTQDAIKKAMLSNKERYVALDSAVPVFIGYFTAWVDSKGLLNFRNDVYGHDARMEKQMFR
ncbi:MAG: L,D-transpeptidase family protein [Chitinophagaceae bacterium]|nr:L,D-transpeptidase family protein [Chitinophagaceae bacterium]MCW5926937.1 L,D-transpeptidase family protein [Chitinophagaceae bacterium]